ncbi:MAG: hypothetical protein WA061_01840 [Microgenomates group bacterium]
MKLVLCKMKKDEPEYWSIEELLFAGLNHDNVYLGTWHGERKEFSVSYNGVYDCYDVSLFPILGNSDQHSAHFDEFEDWLKNNEYSYKRNNTWTWWNKIKYDGARFFIEAK